MLIIPLSVSVRVLKLLVLVAVCVDSAYPSF